MLNLVTIASIGMCPEAQAQYSKSSIKSVERTENLRTLEKATYQNILKMNGKWDSVDANVELLATELKKRNLVIYKGADELLRVSTIKSITQESRRPSEDVKNSTEGVALSEANRPVPTAWGTPEAAAACNAAIKTLKATRSKDTSSTVLTKDKLVAELLFETACLSRNFSAQLDLVVGRVTVSGLPECTGTLIGRRIVATALHCAFTLPPRPADRMRAVPKAPLLARNISVEFGPPANLLKSYVVAVHVFGEQGQMAWSRFSLEELKSHKDGYLKVPLRGDFVLLELDRDVTAAPPIDFDPNLELSRNEPIVIYGYYYVARLRGGQDDSAMRSQAAGMCQVLEHEGSCVLHGCATVTGYSGAPLLVRRTDSAGNEKFVMAALQVDSEGELSGCETRKWNRAVNAGLRLPPFATN